MSKPQEDKTALPDPVRDVENADITLVELFSPIRRGENEHRQITLRRPKVGELRGLALASVLQLDIAAISKLLPRISTPMLAERDFETMPVDDFTSLALATAGFFVRQ